MAKVLEVMITTCFRTHIYRWNNEVRRQAKGGAIGLRATGSVARATMDWWIREFRKRLEAAGIKVWLLKKVC